MKKIISRLHTLLAVLLIVSITGQNVALAKPVSQQGKPRIGHSDTTGKVVFIGADPANPIAIRAAQTRGFDQSERAQAMVAQYAADFGLRNPASELSLLSEKQVGNRNVTRFQQTYQNIPVIAGELVVNATDSAGLISISGEMSPDLSLNTKPTITAQEAIQSRFRTDNKNIQPLF